MTDHGCWVGEHYPSGTWDVSCACGWEALEFETRDAAMDAANEHRASAKK